MIYKPSQETIHSKTETIKQKRLKEKKLHKENKKEYFKKCYKLNESSFFEWYEVKLK